MTFDISVSLFLRFFLSAGDGESLPAEEFIVRAKNRVMGMTTSKRINKSHNFS